MVLIKDLATREIVMVSVYGLTVVKVKSHVTRPMQINFLVCVSAHMNFSAASKYFIVRRRLFFPTTKHPKVTRLAFDRAQLLEWVLLQQL